MNPEEEKVWRAIQRKDLQAFEQYFRENYRFLLMASFRIVRDTGLSRELVNDVFIKVWEDGASMHIETSLKSYLHRTVVNRSLNEVNRLKTHKKRMSMLPPVPEETPAPATLEEDELRMRMYREIEALPEQCKKVFKLSRFEDLDNQEIAEKLGISAYTVKNHIAHALKLLTRTLIFFAFCLVLWRCFFVLYVLHG